MSSIVRIAEHKTGNMRLLRSDTPKRQTLADWVAQELATCIWTAWLQVARQPVSRGGDGIARRRKKRRIVRRKHEKVGIHEFSAGDICSTKAVSNVAE